MVDVISIGAGGGSIAWIDRRPACGSARKSASANPGPACYGQGGEEPTVTDADVVLGYISPDRFLGGRMALGPDLAAAAIEKRIAGPLFGGDVIAAAAGIRRVVDAQMADLIRKTTLQRGYDPRRFAMMAYGGSGPVHAASYGGDLGVKTIIIPYHASVHSAYGGGLSDVRFSLRYSDPLTLPVAPEKLEGIYARMEEQGAQASRGRGRTPRRSAVRALGRGALSAPGPYGPRAGARTHRPRAPGTGDRGGLRGGIRAALRAGLGPQGRRNRMRRLRPRRHRRGREAGGPDDERREGRRAAYPAAHLLPLQARHGGYAHLRWRGRWARASRSRVRP